MRITEHLAEMLTERFICHRRISDANALVRFQALPMTWATSPFPVHSNPDTTPIMALVHEAWNCRTVLLMTGSHQD
jgi:hypothetical protein